MTTPDRLHVTVSTTIPASPDTVYRLISDVPAMSRFSPETVRASWLDRDVAAVGVRFKGVNAIGRLRWTTRPVITAAEPSRHFAFRVPAGARSTWSYRLEPTDGGTVVTESVHTERPVPAVVGFLIRRAGVSDRAEHLREGMRLTLARLAAAAVAAAPSYCPADHQPPGSSGRRSAS